MVRTFLKVYMELVSYFLFLQDQIKDIIIIIHTSKRGGEGDGVKEEKEGEKKGAREGACTWAGLL